jgi:hypothetical protein
MWCRRFPTSELPIRCRHCERSDAIQRVRRSKYWIASSLCSSQWREQHRAGRDASCPAPIPITCRGSGTPFDRQNLVFAGAVASTVEPPHRRPVLFGKSGKRRANRPAAPEESLVVHSELKQKIGPYKRTQKQGRVLPFGVPSRIGHRRKHTAIPARQCRPIVNAPVGVLFCQSPEKGPPAQGTI